MDSRFWNLPIKSHWRDVGRGRRPSSSEEEGGRSHWRAMLRILREVRQWSPHCDKGRLRFSHSSISIRVKLRAKCKPPFDMHFLQILKRCEVLHMMSSEFETLTSMNVKRCEIVVHVIR